MRCILEDKKANDWFRGFPVGGNHIRNYKRQEYCSEHALKSSFHR